VDPTLGHALEALGDDRDLVEVMDLHEVPVRPASPSPP